MGRKVRRREEFDEGEFFDVDVTVGGPDIRATSIAESSILVIVQADVGGERHEVGFTLPEEWSDDVCLRRMRDCMWSMRQISAQQARAEARSKAAA